MGSGQLSMYACMYDHATFVFLIFLPKKRNYFLLSTWEKTCLKKPQSFFLLKIACFAHLSCLDLFSLPLLQLLQELGINVPSGRTRDEHTASAIALYLVLHGADLNFYNHEGKTPLDLCLDQEKANLLQQVARTRPR